MFCGYRHFGIDHKNKLKLGTVCISGIEGYRSFAKERPVKHHGLFKEKFLSTIQEMEWRNYNRKKG